MSYTLTHSKYHTLAECDDCPTSVTNSAAAKTAHANTCGVPPTPAWVTRARTAHAARTEQEVAHMAIICGWCTTGNHDQCPNDAYARGGAYGKGWVCTCTKCQPTHDEEETQP